MRWFGMADDLDSKRTGNEPAPLLLILIAILPLLVVAGWFFGLFG
jgi:hypothetical protein